MSDKKLLSAEDIFAANDTEIATVDVPEWGGAVRVRTMTALEADEFGDTEKKDALVRLVEICAIDADGGRLFQKEHLEKLRGKNWNVILRIHQAAAKLNGLTTEGQAAAKNG